MLRGNLATRPFYNERAVSMALAIAAAGVVALTAYNGYRLVSLSAERRSYQARIARDEAEAARTNAAAQALQKDADKAALVRLAGATREANDLIDQRTFSWSAFFATLEKTMPLDVRLVAVSPRADKGTFRVTMTVIGRELDDFDVFSDALQDTGAFYDVLPTDQQRKDDGMYTAQIEAAYLPARAPSKVPESTAPASPVRPAAGGRP